ncbi:hypothetical protein LI951_00535 [Enterococcus sp. BWT-B8]|uniref:hypothetical protein n=1 Tax=Enterococcus sp. BWT-B8 TaxID=2885157 RepID=UPI001E40E0BF|nr:hypothetical protein [Enterococcus sp. BWT-B8]MCB5950545.1 hypothetical protein [Enterococcus sp. BWT-B8]
MKIKIKKQTHWGCLKPLTVTVNNQSKVKLFNCIPLEIEAQPGDEISFKEGIFSSFKKIEVTVNTHEILITNSNNLQQLFLKFMLPFLVFTVSCLIIQSMLNLAAFALVLFIGFIHVFRLQSYQFEIDGQLEWSSSSHLLKLYK